MPGFDLFAPLVPDTTKEVERPPSKSDIQVLRYPLDFTGDDFAESPHWVCFFVNLPENRSEAQEALQNNNATYFDPTGQNRITVQTAEENTRNLQVGSALALGVAGAAASGIGSLLQGVTSATQSPSLITNTLFAGRSATVGAVGGAAVGGAAGAALGYGLGTVAGQMTEVRRLVRMPVCIGLQVQDRPSASYKAEWADQEMGMLGALGAGATAVDVIKAGGRDLMLKFLGSAKASGLGFDFRAYTNTVEKRVRNPQKEQLFRNMGFREFAFDYVFMPKSEKEAEEVETIINTFKQYMHPELSADRMWLKYPGEFSIQYHYKDGVNTHLHKISSCALREVKVSNGGSDFMTFKGTEGRPTEIFLSLSFVELETLTSARIKDGY